MAASFKQQCPSCEAMVLVKDHKEIGKKTDCPRCKYRFVVAAPAEEAAANGDAEIQDEAKTKPKTSQAVTTQKPGPAPAAPTIRKKAGPRKAGEADEAKPKKKKPQSSGSGVLILGIGVSICAVALLGIGGYFLFLSPKEETRRTNRTTVPRFTRPVEITTKKEEGPALAEMTNLLPNDTQGILNLNLKAIVHGAVGRAAFGTPGGFRPDFIERRVGLKAEEVDRVLVAQNFSEDWVFAVVRTAKPIKLAELQKTLNLKLNPEGLIHGQDYYRADRSPWLDHLGRLLGEFYPSLQLAPPLRLREPAFRLVDSQTLIVADWKPLKAFLDAKGQPKPFAAKEDKDKEAPARPNATLSKIYLTVKPELKTLIEQMERGQSSLVCFAWEVGPIQKQMERAADLLKPTGLADEKVIALLRELNTVGASLQVGEKTTLAFGMGSKEDTFAKNATKQLRGQAEAIREKGAFQSGQVQIEFDGKPLAVPPKGANVPVPDIKVSVRTALADKVLVLNAELQFPNALSNSKAIQDFLQPRMLVLRGLTDMVGSPSRINELAAAAVKLTAKGSFPRGTYDRPMDGNRLGRPYPPGERVSWMAELLPYLGYDNVYQQIRLKETWKSPINAVPGSVLVPAFLDSRSPPNTWWVRLPHLGGRPYGATHFVGIAGVGLDAADYAADDKTTANKLGILGYDRQTAVADIKNGTANTILMLQVPPTYQRPWIAGGGATLMGVPETNSIRPFVGTHEKGRGTYAIMADGSVRFLSESISDEAFKAMCTINGGGAELKTQPLK